MESTSTSQPPRNNTNAYYENWLIQLQNFLQKLNAISDLCDDDFSDEEENSSSSSGRGGGGGRRRELVTQVLDHYQDYYREKFKSTNRDVFLLVSPPWYTSLERTFLWVAGFKPSTLFPTINYSIGSELTTEQEEKLNRLKTETKREEKVIEKQMAKVQESVAAPPVYELMKRGGLLIDGEVGDLESIIDRLKQSMMSAIETAEQLRGSTIKKVLDILRQKQAVKLLAAVAQFHLQARKLGLQMDIPKE